MIALRGTLGNLWGRVRRLFRAPEPEPAAGPAPGPALGPLPMPAQQMTRLLPQVGAFLAERRRRTQGWGWSLLPGLPAWVGGEPAVAEPARQRVGWRGLLVGRPWRPAAIRRLQAGPPAVQRFAHEQQARYRPPPSADQSAAVPSPSAPFQSAPWGLAFLPAPATSPPLAWLAGGPAPSRPLPPGPTNVPPERPAAAGPPLSPPAPADRPRRRAPARRRGALSTPGGESLPPADRPARSTPPRRRSPVAATREWLQRAVRRLGLARRRPGAAASAEVSSPVPPAGWAVGHAQPAGPAAEAARGTVEMPLAPAAAVGPGPPARSGPPSPRLTISRRPPPGEEPPPVEPPAAARVRPTERETPALPVRQVLPVPPAERFPSEPLAERRGPEGPPRPAGPPFLRSETGVADDGGLAGRPRQRDTARGPAALELPLPAWLPAEGPLPESAAQPAGRRTPGSAEPPAAAGPVLRAAGRAALALSRRVQTRLARLGAGRPIPPGPRARLEKMLALPLGGVRLHTEPEAAAVAGEVGAAAATVGPHILMREARHGLEGRRGLSLLAHEAVHALEQRATHPGAPAARREEALARAAEESVWRALAPGAERAAQRAGPAAPVSMPLWRGPAAATAASTRRDAAPLPPRAVPATPAAGPLRRAPAARSVARQAAPAAGADQEAATGIDIETLAEEIYRRIRYRLELERERRGF